MASEARFLARYYGVDATTLDLGSLETHYVAHHGVDGTLVGSQACGPEELAHGPIVACGGELFFGSASSGRYYCKVSNPVKKRL